MSSMQYQNTGMDVKAVYIVLARIFKQGKLFGYRLQEPEKIGSGQPAIFDVSRERFNELVKAGLVDYVKMTTSGPSGCDGFALKEVKSITLDVLYKVVAGLRIWGSTIIAYVIQYNGTSRAFINGTTVLPHGYFIERTDNLNWLLSMSNMDDIRTVGRVNNLTICYPVISHENLKDFIGTIDIEREELDHSHAYLREPYVFNGVIRQAIKMIQVPSSYISDINYTTLCPFSDDEQNRYQAYMQHILALDIKSHGRFGETLEQAKAVSELTEDYLNKFRDTPYIPNKTSNNAENTETNKAHMTDNKMNKQGFKPNTRDNLLKPKKRGIAGIFDIFRLRNRK